MNIREITKVPLPLVALLLIGTFTACGSKEGEEQEGEEEQQQIIPVTTDQVKRVSYTPSLRFSGTAEASRSAHLGASLPGKIEKIYYQRGSYVPEGALIVEMSDEMLIQAQIENDALRRDFQRISRLREKESISQMDYDHIKAKYEASVAKVAMLKKSTSITAPFGGVITDILAHEGETYAFTPSLSSDLKLESGIVALQQLNPLKVTVEVNEKELRNITLGQQVAVTFDAFPSEPVEGKVSYIPPVLSSLTRTASLEVSIPNKGNRLKPGMYCTAVIALPEREGLFVPMNAISRLGGTSEEFIFKLQTDGITVRRIPLLRQESYEGMVQVESRDFEEGDSVIIDGKNKLDDGTRVKVITK